MSVEFWVWVTVFSGLGVLVYGFFIDNMECAGRLKVGGMILLLCIFLGSVFCGSNAERRNKIKLMEGELIMEQLKLCPFCGRIPDHGRMDDKQTGWFIVCDRCGARGPLEKTVDKAIKSWNERLQ